MIYNYKEMNCIEIALISIDFNEDKNNIQEFILSNNFDFRFSPTLYSMTSTLKNKYHEKDNIINVLLNNTNLNLNVISIIYSYYIPVIVINNSICNSNSLKYVIVFLNTIQYIENDEFKNSDNICKHIDNVFNNMIPKDLYLDIDEFKETYYILWDIMKLSIYFNINIRLHLLWKLRELPRHDNKIIKKIQNILCL